MYINRHPQWCVAALLLLVPGILGAGFCLLLAPIYGVLYCLAKFTGGGVHAAPLYGKFIYSLGGLGISLLAALVGNLLWKKSRLTDDSAKYGEQL
jgi:hypothetical protein